MSPLPCPWDWEDAFDKFGFDDGDGDNYTGDVELALQDAGFETDSIQFGLHNLVIHRIARDGIEYIRKADRGFALGYDCPRSYLPAEIVALLDKAFPKA